MSTLLETKASAVRDETPISSEVREAVLERVLAEQAAEGWEPETKSDNERVLVGHNKFRRILVRRQWGLRSIRELVDVDKRGTVSIRRL